MLSAAFAVSLVLLKQTPEPPPPTSSPPTSTATSTSTVVKLSQQVATLRTEVDALADDVGQQRRALNDELAALSRRSAELQARLEQATTATRAYEERRRVVETDVASGVDEATATLVPVREALARLAQHQQHVPFRLHARTAARLVVERSLPGLGAEAAAAAVWPLLLDEARLLTEQGRVKQAIVVDGTPLVAEVAHVGPLIVWRSGDRAGGVRTEADGSVVFVDASDAATRQQIAAFLEAFKRDRLAGTWLLPASPPSATPKTGSTP
jgi:hypothetical protein